MIPKKDNFKVIDMNKFITILMVLILHSYSVNSQKLFTADRELSNSDINSICQDKDGVIWIATKNGLNKYDGAKFTVYSHDENDKNSLIDDNVITIKQIKKGFFLIGTLHGLQFYNPRTNDFSEIPIYYKSGRDMNAHITDILERKNGEILFATSGHGVYTLSLRGGNKLVASEYKNAVTGFFVDYLFEDKEENLWIATDGKGVISISKNGKIRKYFCENDYAWNTIASICQDENGSIYAGTKNKGLFVFDKDKNRFMPISFEKEHNLPINILYHANRNELYIGTKGYGIKVCDIRTKVIKDGFFHFTTFNSDKSDVKAIMKDKKGNLWIGLKGKGVMILPYVSNHFKYIGYKSLSNNIIGSNQVSAICQDKDGTLWIGTENDGIYTVKNKNKLLHHYEHTNSKQSVSSIVSSIISDQNHNLWIGSPINGLAQMNTKDGTCKYYTLIDYMQNNVSYVTSLANDNQNRIWVGTMGGGLFYIDLKTNKVHRSPTIENGKQYRPEYNIVHNRWISTLLFTRHNKLYIGTYDGLGCLDVNSMNFVSTYKMNRLFPDTVVYSLCEGYKNTIWIGTSKGLISLNEKTKVSKVITIRDGLPSNAINAIVEDKNRTLWISTDYGISHYNPKKGTFENYYAGDGVQGNEFSKNAGFIDKDGNLMFGGVNGITYFNPNDISRLSKKPEIRIVDFYIHDKAVKAGMHSGHWEIINTSVSKAKEFDLSYKDNSFSIEFTAMEFYNPERITYFYSINNEHWTKLRPGINRVTFSSMSPGKYHFRVKSQDNAVFSDVKEILITIHPAWYASWWAKFVYFLLFIASVYLIYVQIRHRYRVHVEMQKHIQAEQINEAKLQFFINISHEIRTPMSLIISPLQQLIASDKDTVRQKRYTIIQRNAERILRLINQLMDIRKIDKGQMTLSFQKIEMVEFIRELCKTFEDMASAKQISLDFITEKQTVDLWIDPRNFDKIIVNLVSNALKFTQEKGHVEVLLRTVDDNNAVEPLNQYAEIIISDDGIKIDENEKEHIFERFYQIRNSQNNSNVGTGIGLHLTRSLVELHHGTIQVENNLEKGCRFIIRIPMGCKHLNPDEIIDEEQPFEIPNRREELDIETVAVDSKEEKIRSKGKYRVLVVDDEEEIRNYIRDELSDKFHVTVCSNGKEALDQILKKKTDIVISDVMMPEMDGLTLCHKIKQNITINSLPVILLTAKCSEEDNLEGLDYGADAYITKPFSIEILKKTISNILQNREQLRNTYSGKQNYDDKIEQIKIQSPDDKLMERILKVVNENLGNPNLDIVTITERVGISRVHLYRKMRELTNQSPSIFIRNVRLQQAAKLLSEKRQNISEIAEMTGFSSVAYFSSTFKELYGMSPKEYMDLKFKESTEN